MWRCNSTLGRPRMKASMVPPVTTGVQPTGRDAGSPGCRRGRPALRYPRRRMTPAAARADLRRWASDGTPYIVGGTIVASLGAYLFQVIGARALGEVGGAAAFDPVSALLTVHFLVFTVLLLPVEQFEIRRITLGRAGGAAAVAWVIAAGAVGATGFTFFTRDHYFDGDAWYALIGFVDGGRQRPHGAGPGAPGGGAPLPRLRPGERGGGHGAGAARRRLPAGGRPPAPTWAGPWPWRPSWFSPGCLSAGWGRPIGRGSPRGRDGSWPASSWPAPPPRCCCCWPPWRWGSWPTNPA